MIVCVCRRVSDRDIAGAVRAGCSSFEELQDELGVGTGCGACCACARETFEHASRQDAGCATAAPARGSRAAVERRAEAAVAAA